MSESSDSVEMQAPTGSVAATPTDDGARATQQRTEGDAAMAEPSQALEAIAAGGGDLAAIVGSDGEIMTAPLSPQSELGVNTAQKVTSNTLIQAVGKLFGYASALVVLSLTTRLLSTSAYGDYTIAIVYVGLFNIIADAGVSIIGVREASQAPETLQDMLNATLTLKVLIAIVAYGVGIVAVNFLPYTQEAKTACIILSVALFFVSVANSFDVVFQSRLRMTVPTLADLAFKAVSLVGVGALFLVAAMRGLRSPTLFYGAVVVTAVAYVSMFVIRWFGVRRLMTLRYTLNLRLAGRLLKMAAPMAVVLVLGQIHYKADAFILALLQSRQDVAIYGVAYKVIDFLLMFFTVFVNTVFPVLANYAKEPGGRFQQMLVRVLGMCVTVALPATTGVILLAPGIIALIGGGKYPQADLTLQILAVSAIFSFINMVYNYLIIIGDRQRSLIWAACISITANVTLNLLAIPRFSYLGSAVATDITECLGMLLSMGIAMRIYKSSLPLRIFARPLVACGAMAGGVLALQRLELSGNGAVNTMALAAAGTIVYGAVLYAIGGVDPALTRQITGRLGRLVGRPSVGAINE